MTYTSLKGTIKKSPRFTSPTHAANLLNSAHVYSISDVQLSTNGIAAQLALVANRSGLGQMPTELDVGA
jgi:hypothetical protein